MRWLTIENHFRGIRFQMTNLLPTSPNILYKLFPREAVMRVKVQLEVLKKISDMPLGYSLVEVKNGQFCKLPV